MLFNSAQFLIFFPIVCLVHFLLPHRIRWIWLLICSYFFYMCWNPEYALLIAASTVITYLSGILIEKAPRNKKIWVGLSLISNLSILFFYKYFHFALNNLNHVFQHWGIEPLQPAFDIILPVGISFYTFQALGYTIDVYREKIKAQKNLAKYALFVSFFPQLVAGPIERSGNLLAQIDEKHSFDAKRIRDGLLLMLWGFFEKMVIADRAAILVNQVYGNYEHYGAVALILATFAFSIQIFCDFSGYSSIAIGAAKVLGFRLMQNFKQPYFASSIAEFWRKWHISLSTWFRDYLYIPLGGSRCSKLKRYRNLMITFLVSGLWHGASWNYVVWGALHGLLQIVGDLSGNVRKRLRQLLRVKEASRFYQLFRMVLTFCMVSFCWVFFRASDLESAFSILQRSFSFADHPFNGIMRLGLSLPNLVVLLLATMLLMMVHFLCARHSRPLMWLTRQKVWLRWPVYFALVFAILIFGAYGPGYDAAAFIYFQF